jgi:hypothetical protein
MSAPGGSWWPSPFGADDQHGMLNHITDAKRAAALALVREGKLYDLGRVLDEHVPVFPGRYFRQTLMTTAHHVNADPAAMGPDGLGENNVNWVIEIVSATTPDPHPPEAARRDRGVDLPDRAGVTVPQPGMASAARRAISSGETSSMWVETLQRWPNGSSNRPVRSP